MSEFVISSRPPKKGGEVKVTHKDGEVINAPKEGDLSTDDDRGIIILAQKPDGTYQRLQTDDFGYLKIIEKNSQVLGEILDQLKIMNTYWSEVFDDEFTNNNI